VRWHWLLPDEVENMSNYLGIKKIGNAHFFNDGECPQFANLSCSIYQIRPLECRLSPISIYTIGNQLHWILDISCPYYRHYKENEEFWKKIHTFVDNIRPFITDKFMADLRNISQSINSVRPLIKDQDYYIVAPLEKLKNEQ